MNFPLYYCPSTIREISLRFVKVERTLGSNFNSPGISTITDSFKLSGNPIPLSKYVGKLVAAMPSSAKTEDAIESEEITRGLDPIPLLNLMKLSQSGISLKQNLKSRRAGNYCNLNYALPWSWSSLSRGKPLRTNSLKPKCKLSTTRFYFNSGLPSRTQFRRLSSFLRRRPGSALRVGVQWKPVIQ